MRTIFPICIMLWFVESLAAQTPPPVPPAPVFKIIGSTSVAQNNLVVLTLSGGKAATTWTVVPFPTPANPTPNPQVSKHTCGQTLIFTGELGSYLVTTAAGAASSEMPILFTTMVEITVAVPPTPPIPPPVPTVPYAIGIFDPATLPVLPQGQISIYNSPTIADAVSKNGYTWLQYSIGDRIMQGSGVSINLADTSWGSSGVAAGLPALVLVNGSNIKAIPMPQDESSIISLLGKKIK